VRIVENRPASDGFAAARKAMIDSQLRTSGVNARFVLERMLAVPRENFVPAEVRSSAYIDRAVPLGDNRFIAPPVFYGMMLQESAPRLDDKALVVDAGSGYLTELMRSMVGSLTVITPAQAVAGEGATGAFSILLVDGAVEYIPAPLAALLAEDGRAVTGLVEGSVTRLAAGRRSGEAVALLPLAEIGIPALPQFARPKAWTF